MGYISVLPQKGKFRNLNFNSQFAPKQRAVWLRRFDKLGKYGIAYNNYNNESAQPWTPRTLGNIWISAKEIKNEVLVRYRGQGKFPSKLNYEHAFDVICTHEVGHCVNLTHHYGGHPSCPMDVLLNYDAMDWRKLIYAKYYGDFCRRCIKKTRIK